MGYDDIQRSLAVGWNTWDTRSVLTQVHLPSAFAIAIGIKEYYTGTTLRQVQAGRHGPTDEFVVLGPHAIDGGYTETTVTWKGITVRVESAHLGEDLVVLIRLLESREAPPVMVVSAGFLWNRPGVVRRADSTLEADSAGASFATTVHATGENVDDPYVDADGPYLALRLESDLGLSTGVARSIEEITAAVAAARAELDAAAAIGGEPEHSAIVRDAISWNTIYEPKKARVITTVSRLWNVGKRGGYGLYCWDAFFNALIAGATSRELAYVNAVEMLRELTPEGFVPNVAQGTGRVTFDGSQPPLGSLVCWELYSRFGESWFLEEVFAPLLSWNRWWWRTRRDGELLCLGSTSFVPVVPSPQEIPRIGQHFGATCESGCDDHPVYSDVPFNTATGLLEAWDIGLNAEYVADCEALAKIADAIGRPAERDELAARGAAVSAGIRSKLWDEGSRVFRNHSTVTGKPTAYLSPMTFYPMLSGTSDAEQSRLMVDEVLRHEQWFGGEWVVPSTPRNDPRTSEQSYWYGRAWPPVNFLVYLALLRSHEREATSWLVERSEALVLKEWREHRHVHENYSSETGEGCDVANSEPFYSWGALLSLMVLIDRGVVSYFAPWREVVSALARSDAA